MATISLFAFFLLFHFTSLHMAEAMKRSPRCSRRFTCGILHDIEFPFSSTQMPSDCGLFMMNCSSKVPQIQLEPQGKWYQVENISQGNDMFITDLELQQTLNSNNCNDLSRFAFPNSPWLRLKTVYECNRNTNISFSNGFSFENCGRGNVYYVLSENNLEMIPSGCSAFKIPESWAPSKGLKNTSLDATIFVNMTVPGMCYRCHYRGGSCYINTERKVKCNGGKKVGRSQRVMKLGLGIGGSLLFITMLAALLTMIWFIRRNDSTDHYSDSDVEASHIFFKIPIISNKELEEATNNFSNDRLLGDGGFGTVYYGKLHDGREVAVKRLYEHNYKRVQQFMNEIEILTCLQHKNLVSLYGCNSRRSRELLLVYEFVPNGTVADHLHGDRSKPGSLTWPKRMNIAIETASALAYLHASDVIHRDVKTTNILLDSNFSVKIADFGLSRSCPNDVSHVSTAPQGTPGYVDPEYHQYYHLTDKSDVYSFGVVLVELISSKPAIDINRSKTEINLSNFAINKIQQRAFGELIDPDLGYETDERVKKMIIMVAELGFRCLQQDQIMRPTMDQVLKELLRIQNDHQKKCNNGDRSNIRNPTSPISVTEQWISRSSTPYNSI